MRPRGIQNIKFIRSFHPLDLRSSCFMVFEGIVFMDFNPTVSNKWMSVKFELVVQTVLIRTFSYIWGAIALPYQ